MTRAFAQATQAVEETARGPDAPADVHPAPILTLEKIEGWIDGFILMLPNIGVAIVVLLVFLCLGWVAKRGFMRWARRRDRESLGDVLGGFIRWLVIAAGILIAMIIVFPSVQPVDVFAGLGIGSVAIGFAFKDILQNWLAGLLILLNRPFRIGDQIVVNDYEGTVHRIETRATDITTYDGRRVLIPNSQVYTNAVTVNTAYRKRRSEYDVGIGMGDDIATARRVILEALGNVPGLERDPAPEALPWEIAAYAVTLKIRWWTDSRRSDVVHVQAGVIEAVKNALSDAGIDMPYETVVQLWHDQTEEWDGIRARQREGWPPTAGGAKPPRPAREVIAQKAPTDSGTADETRPGAPPSSS